MSEAAAPDNSAAPPDPEDQARANLYGLVSRLFYAPADPNLLAEISRATPQTEGDDAPGPLRDAWQALQEVCRSAFPALVRQEFEGLFVGVGKAEVTPYLSAYAQPSSPERYLVRLRDQLAVWALTRRKGAFEVEDHVSGVSDVMRSTRNSRSPCTRWQYAARYHWPWSAYTRWGSTVRVVRSSRPKV